MGNWKRRVSSCFFWQDLKLNQCETSISDKFKFQSMEKLKIGNFSHKQSGIHHFLRVGDNLDITCALINKYYSPAIKDVNEEIQIAAKMREMSKEENALKNRLKQYDEDTKLHWYKYNAATCMFSLLTENDIRDLTFCKDQLISFPWNVFVY